VIISGDNTMVHNDYYKNVMYHTINSALYSNTMVVQTTMVVPWYFLLVNIQIIITTVIEELFKLFL